MDPNVAFRMMIEFFQDDQLEEAVQQAEILKEWVDKGGFKPTETFPWNFDTALKVVLNHKR